MKRVKSTGINTRNEFEATLDDVAAMTVELRKLEAERDAQIQRVQEQYNDDVIEISQQIKGKLALAEKYAKAHTTEVLDGKKKSGETALSVFGFRTSTPSLVLLNSKWNWDEVCRSLLTAGLDQYVVVKTTPDKDAMKARMDDAELASVGCRVRQTESFWVEPKLDEPKQ